MSIRERLGLGKKRLKKGKKRLGTLPKAAEL